MVKDKFLSKIFILLAFCLLAQASAHAQEKKFNLCYYGVVTNVNDQNMLNITQDLFYAQLRGVGNLEP
ncbi:MAG: hypothetical protein K6A42_11480, partial [Treponema sp.]|nr:hypothetical protein [Treponema sp.]